MSAPGGPVPGVVCKCGHPAGHHDDEPEGCWDCDCEAWDEADDETVPEGDAPERSPG